MFELALLVILVALVVLALRGGKNKILKAPVVIHIPGEFHLTVAPQLTQARTFIEQIARQFALSGFPSGELPTQYFKVDYHDGQSPSDGFYLLAVALRGGLLYFQAIYPQPLLGDGDSYLNQMKIYSEDVLALHPLAHSEGVDGVIRLNEAVESAARQYGIIVNPLLETD